MWASGMGECRLSVAEKYRVNPEFITREIAGEVILVPVGSASARFNGLASLNATGYYLWNLLAQPRTRGELSAALAKEYELTPQESAADVDAFLEPALARDVILRCEA